MLRTKHLPFFPEVQDDHNTDEEIDRAIRKDQEKEKYMNSLKEDYAEND